MMCGSNGWPHRLQFPFSSSRHSGCKSLPRYYAYAIKKLIDASTECRIFQAILGKPPYRTLTPEGLGLALIQAESVTSKRAGAGGRAGARLV